ncbi:hypothetical protein PILCRDRAFT_829611 [Piloderma croceum F 1598]|uniref:CHAT domain-containing protein n=1 Tax=Piloderma croceum (strain F 1598) TaxID=765440 RepID=A0A0C3EYA1_PILCF|nr:hypothetical protein PILCRDRAFT_829611 [Piloderma croceum F 1598]
MAPGSTCYVLHVGSADIIVEPESRVLDTEHREFYVEIRVDRKSEHVTRVAKGRELSWEEEFLLTGKGSSIISLSIVPKASGSVSQRPRIGYIDIAITTLLAACADDQVVSLEIASRTSRLIVAIMRVKLREGSDHDISATVTDSEGGAVALTDRDQPVQSRLPKWCITLQTQVQSVGSMIMDGIHSYNAVNLAYTSMQHSARFDRRGNIADLEKVISNLQKAVDITRYEDSLKPLLLNNLAIAQLNRFARLGDMSDLENGILNQQQAVDLTPYGPDQLKSFSNLSLARLDRFDRLGDLSDLEIAILNSQQAVDLTPVGHPDRPINLSNLGLAQHSRFRRLGDLSDLKNAVSNKQQAVDLTPVGHPDCPLHLVNLGSSQHSRFNRLGNLSDLENAILNEQLAIDLTPDGHPEYGLRLSHLGSSQHTRFNRLGNLSDLENAILNKQQAVDLTPDGHPDHPRRLSTLGSSQHTRYDRLGDLSDLEHAISNHQQAVDLTPDGHPDQAVHLADLGSAQQTRFIRLGDFSDFTASISSCKAAAKLKAAHPSVALSAARKWARMSHNNGDLLTALDGYRVALELIQKVAWLGLDARSRQDALLRVKPEALGCHAATCAIQLGRFEEAVELLDLGRSFFWQQASLLRSDLEILKEEHPQLANRFDIICQQLNAGYFSEEIGRNRRHLVGEWEKLVDGIRQLPKFKYFLKPTPFCQLRQACVTGWVIIINASAHVVDALIFGAIGPIKHVPLPNIDLNSLVELARNIILNQPMNPSATQQWSYVTRFLKPALRTIWNKIMISIFNEIVWWYPTGPLTFIPIHAAGPGGGDINVSRLVISSYVTTLGSLMQAQSQLNGTARKGPQKFLTISQSETPDECPLPQAMLEVDEVACVFRSSGWSENDIVCLHGLNATVDHVLHALDSSSWVHFACHGHQDPIFGMNSAFSLHGGDLELTDIASKRLSTGQFAFLSACHAASGLKDLPGEAMHLAAGFQFAGFPSVIATLWRIHDEDAPKIAGHTYRLLFRNGLQGLDLSESAMALNRAVLHLQEAPEATVDRWAPFVHFGI